MRKKPFVLDAVNWHVGDVYIILRIRVRGCERRVKGKKGNKDGDINHRE